MIINMFNVSKYADKVSMLAATEMSREDKMPNHLIVGLVLQDPSIFYEAKSYFDSIEILNGQYGVLYQNFSPVWFQLAYRNYVRSIKEWVRFPGSFSDEIVKNIFTRLLQLKEVTDRETKSIDLKKILIGLKMFGLGPTEVGKSLVLYVLNKEVGKYRVVGDESDLFTWDRSRWIRRICREYWLSDNQIEDWAMRRMALDICLALDDNGRIDGVVEAWLEGWFLDKKIDFGLVYNNILRGVSDRGLMEKKEIYSCIKKALENQ